LMLRVQLRRSREHKVRLAHQRAFRFGVPRKDAFRIFAVRVHAIINHQLRTQPRDDLARERRRRVRPRQYFFPPHLRQRVLQLRGERGNVAAMDPIELLQRIHQWVERPHIFHNGTNAACARAGAITQPRENARAVFPFRHPNANRFDEQNAIARPRKTRHEFLMPLPQIVPTDGRETHQHAVAYHGRFVWRKLSLASSVSRALNGRAHAAPMSAVKIKTTRCKRIAYANAALSSTPYTPSATMTR